MTTNDKFAIDDPVAEQVRAYADKIARGLLKLDEAVSALADAGSLPGIALILAQRLDLTAREVADAIDADSDRPMRVVCRGAGLGINAFSAMLRLRRRRGKGADLSPAEALASYYSLDVPDPSVVRKLLRFTPPD